MIYNLPRRKKKFTWYRYNAVDNRNIVTASVRSYIAGASNSGNLPKVLYYQGVKKSGGAIIGDILINSKAQSVAVSGTHYLKTYYFEYNGNWYHNREIEYDSNDYVTVYAYRIYLDDNWAKGTTGYGTVISEEENAYPANGYQNGYWYVRKE